jgi:hypothetical protein
MNPLPHPASAPDATSPADNTLRMSHKNFIEFVSLLTTIGHQTKRATVPVPAILRDLPALGKIKAAFDQGRLPKFPEGIPLVVEINNWEAWIEKTFPNLANHPELTRGLCITTSYLHHERLGGVVIESTKALEQLLLASDLNDDLPAHLFMPPYPAIYLHFTPYAAHALRVSLKADGVYADIHGVFCVTETGTDGVRHYCLMAVLSHSDTNGNLIGINLTLQGGENDTLNDAIARAGGDKPHLNEWHQHMVSMVAKVFLYMGMKDSRQVAHTPHKDTLSRLALVGNKKHAKLSRQVERLYDSIRVGPDGLPDDLHGGAGDHQGVAPHWRRGHFRMQAHGPKSALRKMIFMMPTLIGKDRLGQQEAPVPKSYKVGQAMPPTHNAHYN